MSIPDSTAAVTTAAAPARPVNRPTPPPPTTPAPTLIRFHCTCGKGLQAQTTYAGRKVRCPGCGKSVSIPGTDGASSGHFKVDKPPSAEGKPPSSVRKVPGRPAAEEEVPELEEVEAVEEPDDEPEETDRQPRRKRPSKSVRVKPKKQGSRALLWLGVTAVVFLVLGGGGGLLAWLLLSPKQFNDDLPLIPGDAQAIVSVRLADVSNSELFKQAAVQPAQKAQLDALTLRTGLAPAEIERTTVVVLNLNNPAIGTWLVVRTIAPYDRDKVSKSLGTPHEVTADGTTFLVTGDDAVYFAGSHILVVGSEMSMKLLTPRLASPRATGPLDPALARLAENHHVLAAVAPSAATTQQARSALAANPFMKAFDPLVGVQTVTATVDLRDAVAVDVKAAYPDEAQAKAAKDALDKGLAGFKAFFPATPPKGSKPNPQMESMKVVSDLLAQLKPEQNAAVVSLSLSVTPDAIGKLALLSMTAGAGSPMAARGAGPMAGAPAAGVPGAMPVRGPRGMVIPPTTANGQAPARQPKRKGG